MEYLCRSACHNITLNSGTGNTIKIQKDAADANAADIDKYTVTTGAAKSAEQAIKNDAIAANSTISVYPNPCDGNSLTIDGVEGRSEIRIFNLTGSLVYSTTEFANGTVQLKSMALKQGVYILRINNSELNAHSLKLIVQ